MTIKSPYEGETYVAFLDISGFKKLMEKEDEAARTLDKFYQTIFNKIKALNRRARAPLTTSARVRSVVVSDSAIIFLNNLGLPQDKVRDLETILDFVGQVNQELIGSTGPSIMTTCSIAYGSFKYKRKFEFGDVAKNYFIGWPYVKAFSDDEYGEPKIQPSQCRILKENLDLPQLPPRLPFSLLETDNKYFYFYWMLKNQNDIVGFKARYKETLESVYRELIELLHDPIGRADLRNQRTS
jgi:hypothetical protein